MEIKLKVRVLVEDFARGLLDVSSIGDVFIQTVKDKKLSTGQIKYQTFQYKIVDGIYL